MAVDHEPSRPARLRARVVWVGSGATTATRTAVAALVDAVGTLADAAIDRALRTDLRPTSAAEATMLLAGEADTEELTEKIQRVVVLAVPVLRMAARGARFTKLPLAMIATSTISIGIAVRSGVRELQLVAALVAYRLEQATGEPADPALVKKVALDLYLKPKRTPDLSDDKLRLVRLTRKWVLGGAFGRSTSKRAAKALEAAERLDGRAVAAEWQSTSEPR